ncbi:CopG domain protein DNA-binding domain protein [Stackebrandtia soli]
MTLRLPEDDDRMLTERAAAERRSKQEIAVEAIHRHLAGRDEFVDVSIDEIMAEDAELLDRLSK